MSRKQKKALLKIGFSAMLAMAGVLLPWPPLSLGCLLAAYLLVGAEVLKEAVIGAVRGQLFDENFLMALATVGAIAIGEYHEAVAVMLFYQLGEWFQRYAVGKSRASIAQLMDIRPDMAEVERDGQLVCVDPEEVEIGEIIVVRPGGRIPLDGVVLEGSSALDTSALTGESLPREVTAGDEVISGCINQTGLLRIQSAKCYADSTVSRILELVENASSKKARVERFITRFARVYTPIVCVAALLLFLVPPIIAGDGWAVWGYRALSFLVVSCPCALVISVPLSFFGGIGGASRCGILIKGSNDLEALARVRTMVFDKTGTLTLGRFRIAEICPLSMEKQELLALAAAVESLSTHPISRSICDGCEDTFTPEMFSDVQEVPGQGVTACYQQRRVSVGNARLMHTLGLEAAAAVHEGTAVHVAADGEYLGYIIVADEAKPGAAQAIADLKQLGVRRTVMLTGDHPSPAEKIAQQLGISEVRAQLLPQQKVEQLEALLASNHPGETLAYVGDGINDAPVLTRADVGIAMGALGSDAAVEAADIVLMDDDPRKLALAVQLSRRTVGIARQNIVFALGVKALVLLLVALGLSGMWMAVFADVGVSVIAILNAMRALHIQKVSS